MNKKCNNCQKDLNRARISKYNEDKDLLICVQCYWLEVEKYKGYEVSHNVLYQNGEVDGSTEAMVVYGGKN